jgi:hypothetical protein
VQKQEIVEKALANFSDPLRRDRYFELYAPEIVLRGYGVVEPGIDSVKDYYYGFWRAIPDARVEAEDIIEVPEKVVVRFSLTGTHRGRLLGIDGTGKEIQLTGMTILRFQEQRCVESAGALQIQLRWPFKLGLLSAEMSSPHFPSTRHAHRSGTCDLRNV